MALEVLEVDAELGSGGEAILFHLQGEIVHGTFGVVFNLKVSTESENTESLFNLLISEVGFNANEIKAVNSVVVVDVDIVVHLVALHPHVVEFSLNRILRHFA
jgi:hypothetical protein